MARMKHSMAHSSTWIGICLAVAAGGAHGCGAGDGGSGAESAGGGAGGTSAGGASAVAPGSSGTTSTGVGGNSPFGSCPGDQSPASCGGAPCAPIDEQAALLCTQGCCTLEGTCGTFNALRGTACVDVSGGDDHACPTETVFGANVPGCCFEGSNQCGVLDVTGLIGQAAGADANNCVLRANVSVVSLAPLSCDGSPVDAAPSGGGA